MLLNENQTVGSASPASICRHSQYSALTTHAAMAATTRLNLTRRGSFDTKRLVRASDLHHSWQPRYRQTRRPMQGPAGSIAHGKPQLFSYPPADRRRASGAGRGELPRGMAIVRVRSSMMARK